MNISQKQTILSEIEAIQNLDLNEIVLKRASEDSPIETLMIGNYTALEFLRLLKKAVTQLKAEIETGIGLILPNQENFHNDYGQIILDKDLGSLKLAIINNSDQQGALLDRLIYYQVRQGFWDRSKIKMHNVNEEKLNSLVERLELIQENLENSTNYFNNLSQDYKSGIASINSFLEEKKKELTSITEMLNSANASIDRINEHVVSASSNDTTISSLLKNINEKNETISTNISDYQSEYSSLSLELTGCKADLMHTLDSAKQNLNESQLSLDFISSKKDEIIRLTGMAADGSLGSKFDQRQKDLLKGLDFWRVAVPAITILAGFWIFAVFNWMHSDITDPWIKLLVNFAKTLPVFVLVGFVYKQYSKERNLQEEYAFKSAVAMTLTAYSDMLENKDADPNKSRQIMLTKSIEQVYTLPMIHHNRDKNSTDEISRLKTMVSEIVEQIKELKQL